MFKLYVVKSVAEYLNVVKKIIDQEKSQEGDLWFRGQSDASYRLIPSALRNTYPIRNQFGYKIEKPSLTYGDTEAGLRVTKMLDEFKRKALPFIKYRPRNDFEWMFLAQHYGLPTRLLDWTTNPLVALYFATPELNLKKEQFGGQEAIDSLLKNGFSDQGASVFAIDPRKINKETCDIKFPVDVAEYYEDWKHYVDPMSNSNAYLPICVLGNFIDDRVRFQSGNFTLHGSNLWALDYYNLLQPLIHKIFIPYEYLRNIKEELNILGITDSFIYPGLDTLAMDIKRKEEKWLMRAISTCEIYGEDEESDYDI